ncbi:MAG TPA: hypothetical protein DEA08_04560 [Planctomycetes bacterium]|nr:hypothetical protein [Planctomycetota bacterium]
MATLHLIRLNCDRAVEGTLVLSASCGELLLYERKLRPASGERVALDAWIVELPGPATVRLSTQAGAAIGEVEVAPTLSEGRDHPWVQLHDQGHYTLIYRVELDEEVPEPEDTELCHGEDEPEEEALPIGAQGRNTIVFATPPAPDARELMPRYVFYWRHDLWLYEPDSDARRPYHKLSAAHVHAYDEAVGRAPERGQRDTWGPRTALKLRVGRLEPLEDGRRELVLDEQAPEWTFDVYNLASPGWRALLERNLPLLPIEYLRATSLHTLLLDFRVGTGQVGARARVRSGGTNWVLGNNQLIDPAAQSGLCMTFAALNRAWFPNSRAGCGPTLSAEEIEASYAGELGGPFTIYHEFGHVYQFSARRGGTEEHPSQPAYLAERPYMIEVSRQGRARSGGVWDRYRVSSGYARGGGQTQGPGEGFAEAFRRRLEGEATGEREVEELLDRFMPTLESVRRVRAQLSADGSDRA